MSVTIRYILDEEKKKKEAANKIPTTPVQEAGTEVVPEKEEQTFDYSKKPEAWSDEDYRAVRQLYSDEQILQALQQPKPENLLEGIFSSVYKKNVPKPSEPDEKTIKRQRTIAGIGDALGLVSQAVSASQGAYVKPRTFEQSALGQLTEKQQKLYDDYIKRSDKYNYDLVNAQIKDYIQGVQDWTQTKENIQKALDNYRKYQLDVAKQAQDAKYKQETLDNTKKRTEAYLKNTEAQIEDRKRRTDIAAQNARNAEKRTEAYIEKLKNPVKTTSGKADYQLVIPATGNDPNAVRDQFGNPVRVFGMSTGEMDQYARKALADKDFINRHPEYRLLFGQKYTADDKRNIAATYLEELYNKQVAPAQVDAISGPGERFSGQIPEIEEPFVPELDEKELDEMFKVIY